MPDRHFLRHYPSKPARIVLFEPGQHPSIVVTAALTDGNAVARVFASPLVPPGYDMMGIEPVVTVKAQLAPPAGPALDEQLPFLLVYTNC